MNLASGTQVLFIYYCLQKLSLVFSSRRVSQVRCFFLTLLATEPGKRKTLPNGGALIRRPRLGHISMLTTPTSRSIYTHYYYISIDRVRSLRNVCSERFSLPAESSRAQTASHMQGRCARLGVAAVRVQVQRTTAPGHCSPRGEAWEALPFFLLHACMSPTYRFVLSDQRTISNYHIPQIHRDMTCVAVVATG